MSDQTPKAVVAIMFMGEQGRFVLPQFPTIGSVERYMKGHRRPQLEEALNEYTGHKALVNLDRAIAFTEEPMR